MSHLHLSRGETHSRKTPGRGVMAAGRVGCLRLASTLRVLSLGRGDTAGLPGGHVEGRGTTVENLELLQRLQRHQWLVPATLVESLNGHVWGMTCQKNVTIYTN